MQKEHNGRPNFWGWRHPFSSAPKIDKTVEKLRKPNGKERTRVACNRDVQQMNIGSLADWRGWQLRKGYRGQFQSKRIAERVDAYLSRTPNVNTADTYYDYKMHTFTFFYVRATNDLKTLHVPYLSSLSPLSGAADVSWKEAKRIDNGHRPFIARICCRLTSYTAENSSVQRFCAVQNF